jgi:UDP-N-acetylglucosamine acyltransferase
VMSSHAALGGHVEVGNHVNVGWGAGVHQFCRLGNHSMVGAASKIVQDVPPFMIADGNPALVRTTNKVGLERSGFSVEAIALVRSIFKAFYKEGLNRGQAVEKIKTYAQENDPVLKVFLEFVSESGRGLS